MANLYIVATPIGNLEDISQRALRILTEVDLILAEDTRVSKNLLTRFNIQKPVLSYHQHSKINKIDYIIGLLGEGKNIALVSDAGTPGISDPGNKLIEEVAKELGNEVNIIPIPGPSSVMAIASVAGFSMDKFVFLGFPPVKKKRKQFFEEMMSYRYPVIFFESPYRIIKTLDELLVISKYRDVEIYCVAGRELTKKFETIYRGNISQVIEEIKKHAASGLPKGEFVVAINNLIK